MKRSYTLWEMLAGIPALHAQYDAEDREERRLRRLDELGLPPREAHLGPQNDYALLLEEFEGFLYNRPESGIDSPDEQAQPAGHSGQGR